MSVPRFLAAVVAGLAAAWAGAAAAALPVWRAEATASYPHDPRAFTQGLFWMDGHLFESTGLVGQSTIRKVRLTDGKVLQSQPVGPPFFGEGSVNWGSEIISLTWQDQVGFRWDARTLALKSSFKYPGEGWGLTQDGKSLIMSDGTAFLRFLEPRSFREIRRVRVTAEGRPVAALNEIEFVKGEVLANVWQTPLIARIDPQSGVVKGWIDLRGLPDAQRPPRGDAVANGIAYDAKGDRLFVTGKLWPRVYQVRLVPAGAAR